MGPAELIVLFASGLTFMILALPYWGAGPNGVLLDLARSFDYRGHYTLVHNIVLESSTTWSTADGSPPEWAGTYPLGMHVLGALGLLLMNSGDPGELIGFGLVSTTSAALSALLLGLLAIDISRRTGPAANAGLRAIVAACICSVCLPFGGLLSGLFELGHTFFLYPAVIATTASWLALVHVHRPVGASAVLAAAATAMLWTYPPILCALGPAAVVLARRRLQVSSTGLLLLAGLFLTGSTALVVWRWRWRFEATATATGEFSTPVESSLLLVLMALSLVLIAHQMRHGAYPKLALAAPAGFLWGSMLIALFAISFGFPPLTNYYVAKLLQAAAVASLPIIVGLMAWALTEVTLARRASSANWLLLGCGVAAVGLLLAAVPQGRYQGPGAVTMLNQRILERNRAANQVDIVEMSSLLGPSGADAGILVDAPGWSYRVAWEDPAIGTLVHSPSAASDWLNRVRGVISTDQIEATLCLDAMSPTGCFSSWLDAHPESSLSIVVRSEPTEFEYDNLRTEYPNRVSVIRVPG